MPPFPLLWSYWADGTLAGISAAATPTNHNSLWSWSGAESLPRDRMSWNNPLNTTQPAPGAIDANPVGVKIYPDLATGIRATVATLLNGYYPGIVAALREGRSYRSWSYLCSELATWGTGCGWISTAYPPVEPEEDDMFTDADRARLDALWAELIANKENPASNVGKLVQATRVINEGTGTSPNWTSAMLVKIATKLGIPL